MRYSNYNLYFIDENQKYIVYNTITNNHIVLDDKYEKNLVNLYDNGMITELSEDEEVAICDSLFYKSINNGELSITIITTTKCNFECKYCVQSHDDGVMEAETYQKIERYIIRNINTFTSLNLIMFGGEPTLAVSYYESFLERIINICKYYKKEYYFSMITNGYLLNEDMLTKLYRLHIWRYTITLDGEPSVHDKYRCLKGGGATFDTIYQNLCNISKRQDLPQISIVVRINITRETIINIEKWKKLYEELLENPHFYLELSLVENRGGKKLAEMKEQLITCKDKPFEDINKAFSKYKNGLQKLFPNIFVCGYVSNNSLTVDYNGKIRACSKLYMENKIGELNKNGTVNIHNKIDLFSIKSDPECRSCVLEPLCQGKRCGYRTVCIRDQILLSIKSNLERKGISICQVINKDKLPIQF